MRSFAIVALTALALASIANCLTFLRVETRRAAPFEDYDQFLDHVRRDTVSGDSIVILAPAHRGTSDYDYAFFRANYVLTGRTVLPAIQDGRLLIGNVDAASVAAVWRGHVALKKRLLWREGAGEFWRR